MEPLGQEDVRERRGCMERHGGQICLSASHARPAAGPGGALFCMAGGVEGVAAAQSERVPGLPLFRQRSRPSRVAGRIRVCIRSCAGDVGRSSWRPSRNAQFHWASKSIEQRQSNNLREQEHHKFQREQFHEQPRDFDQQPGRPQRGARCQHVRWRGRHDSAWREPGRGWRPGRPELERRRCLWGSGAVARRRRRRGVALLHARRLRVVPQG
mmetsp:Transcript_33238/g.94531  ORF Transcript_33238/g.94531 Transcript_33238/m.94531 type:complete len:212 (-) Transcript_33238:282-917(-)